MDTICNVVGVVIGLYLTTFMLLAPNAQPFVFRKPALVESKWTAQDLGTLARTGKVATAVRRLKNAARKSGTPVLEVERVLGVIDAAAEEDIRMALMMVAHDGNDRKKNPLAGFSRTNSAAATCETSGTAGGDGLDLCVKRCESKPSTWDLRTPPRGACYTLCSLAISPCTKGFFSWGVTSKNWGVSRKSWVAEVKSLTSLIHARGVEKTQNMTLSTALADLSFWASAAMGCAGNSIIFQALFVLAVIREGWNYIRRLKKRAKEATDEVMKLKLKPLLRIRGRLLNQEGFHALHQRGAWAIYRESVKAANAERKKAACRMLGWLVCRRSRRAVAMCFVRWQGAGATVDAVASKDDAYDGKDRVAG